MKRVLAWAVSIGSGVLLTLAAVWFLRPAAVHVERIEHPLTRTLAVAAALLAGAALLVGSVYLATRFTVRLFDPRDQPPRSR